MLKYRVKVRDVGAESTVLDITSTTITKGVQRYDIADGDMDVINEVDDEMRIDFEAIDIYGIQNGSKLTGINHVQMDNGVKTKTFDYYDDLTVDSASSESNSFSVFVKENIALDVETVSIDTVFNVIRFQNNVWTIESIDKKKLFETYDNLEQIDTNSAAVGKNEFDVPFFKNEETKQYNDYKVFYYENNKWNVVKLKTLEGETSLEGCKTGEKLSLNSFHEYDSKERDIIELDKDNVYYTKETYITLIFNPTHYFNSVNETYLEETDDDGFMFEKTTEYGKKIVKYVDYPIIKITYEVSDDLMYYNESVNIECKLDNINTLSFNYDMLDNNVKNIFENIMFDGNIQRDEDFDAIYQEGYCGYFSVTRKSIMYDENYVSFDILYDTVLNTIKIPIAQKFETDLFHQDALQTKFIEVEEANAINPIIDLEKDVYIPAIYNGEVESNGKYKHINADYEECREIVFNLHFRTHRDDEYEKWKCERDDYWNGTCILEQKDGKKIVDLCGRVYQYDDTVKDGKTYKDDKTDYFSYFGETPNDSSGYDTTNDYKVDGGYKGKRDRRNKLKEYQSDTLAYLGFTNDDVKYQKSKLTKSFLRLSFYDSDNSASQSLLHTATIFLDGGELFSKYIKHISGEDDYEVTDFITVNGVMFTKGEHIDGKFYRLLSENNRSKCKISGHPVAVTGSSKDKDTKKTIYDKYGVRVNREPMRNNNINGDNIGDNVELLEELRLSSQITVKDKYSSMKSSEGFYFYTYKSNDNGVFPSDIYMRVDFNHAGYGRTIPFMMPYIRKNEENNITRYQDRKSKIKTFDDICYDWSEVDIDDANFKEKDEKDVGYGTIRFMKYSYIKLKYRYDKETKKHIYYLDPDVYGEGVTTNNGHGNKIILNLYEGRIK